MGWDKNNTKEWWIIQFYLFLFKWPSYAHVKHFLSCYAMMQITLVLGVNKNVLMHLDVNFFRFSDKTIDVRQSKLFTLTSSLCSEDCKQNYASSMLLFLVHKRVILELWVPSSNSWDTLTTTWRRTSSHLLTRSKTEAAAERSTWRPIRRYRSEDQMVETNFWQSP